MTTLALRLDTAVRRLCPDVANGVQTNAELVRRENMLWEVMACCVLSSQVRYENAYAASQVLSASGIFDAIYDGLTDANLIRNIAGILRRPLEIDGRKVRYRFPRARARQLAFTRRNLLERGLTLERLVYGPELSTEKRQSLVAIVSGFGPKQASMFLRTCGVSYDFAVLDRHTLRFMKLLDLLPKSRQPSYSTLREYEAIERCFSVYAQSTGYPTGIVDWAVWIVMRALNALRT